MNDLFYLSLILQALEDINLHRNAAPSLTSYKATLFELIVLGEMAGQLSQEAKELEADIPWHRMIAVRHRLVHAPHTVDSHIIEEIVKVYLPMLKDKFSRLQKELEKQDS